MINDPMGHNGGSPWGASPEPWQPQRKWAPGGTVVLTTQPPEERLTFAPLGSLPLRKPQGGQFAVEF